MTRAFEAPARIVYEVRTEPEHVKRRWAPKSFGVIMYECDIDLRVGGKFRFVFSTGMTAGMRVTFAQLDELVRALR